MRELSPSLLLLLLLLLFAAAATFVAWRGDSVEGGVWVWISWKAEETAAARWRRSNSACWAAGSFGGAGREEKVDERRWRDWLRRGERRRLRGRRGGILFCDVVLFAVVEELEL